MAKDPEIQKVLDRATGRNTRAATIGDSAGVIYEPGRPGYVRVTYPASSGRTYPTVVRLRIGIRLDAGTPVIVGLDRNNQPAVIDIDFDGMESGDWNPYTAATTNQVVQTTDLNTSPILLSTAFGASQPLYVTLFPFRYIRNGTLHNFTGISGGIDSSSYIPLTVGQACVVGLFLTPSDTHEIQVSTATYDPVGDVDIQECITKATDGSIPSSFYKLVYGQTLISDTDKLWDARQWINVPDDDYATVQTTDNTQTTLTSISVAEASLLTITGTFSGYKSDYSAAISGTFVAGIRRATGGNATLVGVSVVSNEDSGGTPAFTVDADTGTQTARLRVTGISAETWNWTAKYRSLLT